MDDDLRDVPSRLDDFPRQPRPIGKGGPPEVRGHAFAIDDFHPKREPNHGGGGANARGDQEKREMPGQEQPKSEQRAESEYPKQHAILP